PPVISTIVMSRFARRQRASMSAYFANSLTPPTGLGLLASPRSRDHLDRAARGSVASRKMACRPAGESHVRFKAINSRTGRGSLVAALFEAGAEMDAKPRDLALLPALSLFCAGVAWFLDSLFLVSVFFALGVFARGIAGEPRQ